MRKQYKEGKNLALQKTTVLLLQISGYYKFINVNKYSKKKKVLLENRLFSRGNEVFAVQILIFYLKLGLTDFLTNPW